MRIPKILQNSAIYGVIMVIQKGISFFLLPLYTAYLDPASYGILSVVSSISAFITIVITLGLDSAATRYYYSNKNDKNYIRKLYGNVGLVIILNSVVVGLLFISFHKWLISPIIGKIPFYPFVLIGLLNVIVTPIYYLYQNYLQTSQNGIKYGANTFCYFCTQVGLTVVSLTIFHLGVMGVLLSQLITSVIFFLYAILSFFRKQYLRIDKPIISECFKYSLPLLPHSIANWSNSTIDKLLINGIKSEADAGLYGLGEQYGSMMQYSANAINQAYVPWFFEQVETGITGLRKIQKTSEFAISCLTLLSIFLSLFAQEILGIMIKNPAYRDVWMVVPLINFAFVFQSLYFFFVNVLFLKDTKIVFTITVTTVAVNVGFNLLFIPIFGYIGCGLAALLTFFIKSVFALLLSTNRNKEIRFHWAYMYLIAFIGMALTLLVYVIEADNVSHTLLLKSAVLLAAIIVVSIRYRMQIDNIYHKFLRKKYQ